MKKYNVLLLLLFSIIQVFSFYVISYFRPQTNEEQTLYYYNKNQNLNLHAFFEKEDQVIMTVYSPVTEETIAYIDMKYTGCIPKGKTCVDLTAFQNYSQIILVGKGIYNRLTPLEKEQQLVYLDGQEPYRIYEIISIDNERSVFDDIFVKINKNETVNGEIVTGYIKDKSTDGAFFDLNNVNEYTYLRDEKTIKLVLELIPVIFCLFILSLIIMVRKQQINNARTRVKYIVGASRWQIEKEGLSEGVFLSVASILIAIICHQVLLRKFYLTLYNPKHILFVYCASFIITTCIFVIITLIANRRIKFTDIEK